MRTIVETVDVTHVEPDDRFAGTDVREPASVAEPQGDDIGEFARSDAEAAADVPAPVSVDEHVAQDRNLPGDATTMVQNDEGAPDRREI